MKCSRELLLTDRENLWLLELLTSIDCLEGHRSIAAGAHPGTICQQTARTAEGFVSSLAGTFDADDNADVDIACLCTERGIHSSCIYTADLLHVLFGHKVALNSKDAVLISRSQNGDLQKEQSGYVANLLRSINLPPFSHYNWPRIEQSPDKNSHETRSTMVIPGILLTLVVSVSSLKRFNPEANEGPIYAPDMYRSPLIKATQGASTTHQLCQKIYPEEKNHIESTSADAIGRGMVLFWCKDKNRVRAPELQQDGPFMADCVEFGAGDEKKFINSFGEADKVGFCRPFTNDEFIQHVKDQRAGNIEPKVYAESQRGRRQQPRQVQQQARQVPRNDWQPEERFENLDALRQAHQDGHAHGTGIIGETFDLFEAVGTWLTTSDDGDPYRARWPFE